MMLILISLLHCTPKIHTFMVAVTFHLATFLCVGSLNLHFKQLLKYSNTYHKWLNIEEIKNIMVHQYYVISCF